MKSGIFRCWGVFHFSGLLCWYFTVVLKDKFEMTKQQRNLLFLLQYRTVAVITVIPGSLTVNRSRAPPNVMVTPTIWYFPPQRWLRDAQNVTLLQPNRSCVMVCPSPGGFGCKLRAGGWSWVRRCCAQEPQLVSPCPPVPLCWDCLARSGHAGVLHPEENMGGASPPAWWSSIALEKMK